MISDNVKEILWAVFVLSIVGALVAGVVFLLFYWESKNPQDIVTAFSFFTYAGLAWLLSSFFAKLLTPIFKNIFDK